VRGCATCVSVPSCAVISPLINADPRQLGEHIDRSGKRVRFRCPTYPLLLDSPSRPCIWMVETVRMPQRRSR